MMRPSPRNGVLLDRLKGFIADLPTPFDVAGDIDWKAFGVLFERQIAHGATAVVVGETSGEASTLSRAERAAIIRAAIDLARDRVAVIAGAGSNSTDQAIELTALAKSQGADAALSVVPYYNKPMQPGILKHFRSIAATTNLPILLHDAPSRSAVSLADETAILLAEHRGIVGLCDAAGSVTRLSRLRRALPPGFRLFCGSEADALSYLVSGGDGCISSLANLSPDLCREVERAFVEGTLDASRAAWARLAPLSELLAGDAPVAAVKYGMSLLGIMRSDVRLPLAGLTDQQRRDVAKAMVALIDGPDPIPARWPS